MTFDARRMVLVFGVAITCLSADCVSGSHATDAATAASATADVDLAGLANLSVSADPAIASAAVTRLRAAGPRGLDALFDAYPGALARLGGNEAGGDSNVPRADRLRAAVEGVARQRDAHASHLYWYTDLDEAIRAARAAKRPILSLRLLGNLDEELSCANSRFFRTALYPNAEISRYLRDNFILHWKSERPAPRITVDFGDGRKIERTITGNSVHYVLDWNGKPVDALPGLYGPVSFLKALQTAEGPALLAGSREGAAREDLVRAYHVERLRAEDAEWKKEVEKLGYPGMPQPMPIGSPAAAPPANIAMNVAAAKMAPERPLVAAVMGPVDATPRPESPAWAALIADHARDAELDAESRSFMRTKIANDVDPSGKSLRALDDASFAKRVAGFEKAIAEDSVRNEYALHRVIHEWMQLSPTIDDYEALNRRIYTSLFLTPSTDPWLGLLAANAYSAIDNEGLVGIGENANAAAAK